MIDKTEDGAWALWDAMSLAARELVVKLASAKTPLEEATIRLQLEAQLSNDLGVEITL